MDEGKPNNTRGRILLIVLGVVALTFIVAAISSNLSIWRQNDAVEAAAGGGEWGLSGSWRDRLEVALYSPPSFHQVVICLQAEEKSFRHAEIPRQSQIGIGCHRPLAEYDLVDTAGWNVHSASQRILAEPHRL
ncbi:hypothetical protein VE25_06720 [Devosia geojensis]|uniref:Uncharacterized protein n=1 Tax=Devosia geojensis TaxID=443610 RepID=A0A0F5FUS4_9HYPH|nr:hypothetical protein VE25_06720 [Devosia geojensis]